MKNKKFNCIVLLIFTILVLFATLKNDFTNIVNNILNMNKWWLLCALIPMFLSWFLRSLILKRYINHYKKNYSYKSAFKLQLETAFFNGITPFSSGGQPFQLLVLRKEGLRIGQGANVIFITTYIYQFALFIIATISIFLSKYLNIFTGNTNIKYLSLIGYFINIIFMAILLLIIFDKKFKRKAIKIISKILRKFKFIKKRESIIAKMEEHLIIMEESSNLIRHNVTDFAILVFYNVIAIILFLMVPIFISYAMGLVGFISLKKVIVTSLFVELAGSFIPIPGGTVGTEYAFVMLFSSMIGISNSKSLMLVWRFITYYLGIIVGALVLNIDKLKAKK